MPSATKSRFIISLDFELLWGVRDKRTKETYGANILGVRQVIPALLELFDRYSIHATFATVGFLFAQNRKELQQYLPGTLPKYTLAKYSPYEGEYLESIGNSEAEDPYHYAASLIKLIQQYPDQEIASHTFSHYYCLEGGSLESFEADMKAAKNIATGQGLDLKTIIFPRNQYSPEHLAICKKLGFIAYRGNETSSVYTPRKNEDQNRWIRGARLADSYFNLTGHHTFTVDRTDDLVNIPASRFLRPWSTRLKQLDFLRLQRIKNSLTHAAHKGECYHLWWHPHNFGTNLKENLGFLEAVLMHYRALREKTGIQSRNMKEIAEEILTLHAVK